MEIKKHKPSELVNAYYNPRDITKEQQDFTGKKATLEATGEAFNG